MIVDAQSLSGWGRYPVVRCHVRNPGDPGEMVSAIDGCSTVIARGNGRSYGDASLNINATLDARRMNRLLSFDVTTGALVCEAGVLLSDLIDAMLPRGWFVPVTPGTKLVTIGGLIASDVHGKNHHGAGSFCDHVAWIDLAVGDGSVLRCSPHENVDIFAATCGGMGLTGVILRAEFRLIPVESAYVRQRTIRAVNLEEAFDAFERTLDWTYSVAWIDCLATGEALGRSAILLGEHALPEELGPARAANPFARRRRHPKRVPIDFPGFALGRTSVRLFNKLYYAAQRPGDAIVSLDPYFYPLDGLREWNRIYGKRGFVQYQCVLPLEASLSGMRALLTEIAATGDASFLAVLKRMGRESFGLLSFPLPGYTLALDFPASAGNLALLDRLDAITADHGGRIYLAKDARAHAATFAPSYPKLGQFQEIRARLGLDRRFASNLSHRLEL